jgi:branched-subunit amino acid transport protein
MNRVWTAIVLSGAGTFAMRSSFLAVAHRLALVPPGVQRLLRQIPPAALASLVIPALLRPEGHVDLTQARLYAGIIAAVIAWKTRSTILTLVVGMGVLLAVQAVV